MKICPNCNRAYEDDTLTFCLDDGSVLSESHGPPETQRIPAPRSTNSAPTELYPTRRPNELPPTPYPTIPAPQPPPFYTEKPQSQTPEKRGGRTGLFIVVAVLLGIILGVWLTISFLNSGKDNAKVERPEISNTNATPPGLLTELPGESWEQCENFKFDICGLWTRTSDGQWRGQWGGVQANLSITLNGKNVTVTRRDLTAATKATYRGTLNADNTQITGTVEWCCDTLGDRSGTWHAKIK